MVLPPELLDPAGCPVRRHASFQDVTCVFELHPELRTTTAVLSRGCQLDVCFCSAVGLAQRAGVHTGANYSKLGEAGNSHGSATGMCRVPGTPVVANLGVQGWFQGGSRVVPYLCAHVHITARVPRQQGATRGHGGVPKCGTGAARSEGNNNKEGGAAASQELGGPED